MSQAHVLSIRTHLVVYFALLGLLVLTIAVAYVDLGPVGLAVAMAIAVTKAVIIMLYFMHVKFSSPLIWIFAGASFFWLFFLAILSFNDYLSRGWLDVLGK